MKYKKAYIEYKGLEIEVEVKDHKNSYGKDRCLVTPISGKGEVWMENVSIT